MDLSHKSKYVSRVSPNKFRIMSRPFPNKNQSTFLIKCFICHQHWKDHYWLAKDCFFPTILSTEELWHRKSGG